MEVPVHVQRNLETRKAYRDRMGELELCVARQKGCIMEREDGSTCCEVCNTYFRELASRRRISTWAGFGIIIYSARRAYLASSFKVPGSKLGQSGDLSHRLKDISKACGAQMYLAAEHHDRGVEQELLRYFGRRDPWYDGDGKTEWPDATFEEVLLKFLAEGGREHPAAEHLLAAQSKMIWLPNEGRGFRIARFQIVTNKLDVAPCL